MFSFMLNGINKKLVDLKDQSMGVSFVQKGLTLVELLVSIVIIGIITAVLFFAFPGIFGKVDGTELVQDSRKLETAVLQGTFANDKRTVPGVKVTPTETLSTKFKDKEGKWSEGSVALNFGSDLDSARVIEAVADSIGVVGFNGKDLAALLAPIDPAKVGKVAGRVDSKKYFVVLNKNQVFKEKALDDYSAYKDELAGRVISLDTLIDADGNYFNGSFEIKSDTMEKYVKNIKDVNKGEVFSTPDGTGTDKDTPVKPI